MNKYTKRLKMIAGCMIAIGILLTIVGFSSGAKFAITNTKDGFKVLNSEDLVSEEFSLGSFTNINSNLDDIDIEIIPSNEYKLKIQRPRDVEIDHKVENDTLFIEEVEQSHQPKFLVNLTLTSLPQTVIKVYVPKNVHFSEIAINNQFGDIEMEGITSGNITIDSNDGDITFNDVQINSLTINNQFGDITGRNVSVKELLMNLKDGDVEFDSIHADSTVIKNQFGDMTFRNLTSNGFSIQSNDGDLDIQGQLLGTTSIQSNFGDVDVVLLNKESEMSYSIKNDFGDITVGGNEYEKKAEHTVNSNNILTITVNDGDVTVHF